MTLCLSLSVTRATPVAHRKPATPFGSQEQDRSGSMRQGSLFYGPGWPELRRAIIGIWRRVSHRSSMRPVRLCRESAAPTWLARAPLHAAAISCCVLPVASARTWSPRFDELCLLPADFAVVVGGRPCHRAGATGFVAVIGVPGLRRAFLPACP